MWAAPHTRGRNRCKRAYTWGERAADARSPPHPPDSADEERARVGWVRARDGGSRERAAGSAAERLRSRRTRPSDRAALRRERAVRYPSRARAGGARGSHDAPREDLVELGLELLLLRPRLRGARSTGHDGGHVAPPDEEDTTGRRRAATTATRSRRRRGRETRRGQSVRGFRARLAGQSATADSASGGAAPAPSRGRPPRRCASPCGACGSTW